MIYYRIYVIHSASSKNRERLITGHYFVLDSIVLKGRKKDNTVFFDSYGRHFSNLGHRTLERKLYNLSTTAKLECNTVRYQRCREINCGHLSVYHLLMRARGHDLKTIQQEKFGQQRYWRLIPALIKVLLPLHGMSRIFAHE